MYAVNSTNTPRLYVDLPHGQMHVRRVDRSTRHRPLLCFHMSPYSGAVYHELLHEMGRDRLAIAPDTPGFGESDPPVVVPSINDYAAAMAGLIDALSLTEVDLLGYHTGSKIAVALALLRPAQVKHLVLISAPVFTDVERAEFRQTYAPATPDEDGRYLADKWHAAMHWRGPGQTVAMVAEHFHEGLRRPGISWWGHYAAFEFELAAALPRVTQPVRILNPGDDLTDHTRRAAPLIANGELIELPDWGHGLLQTQTAALAGMLRAFFDADET